MCQSRLIFSAFYVEKVLWKKLKKHRLCYELGRSELLVLFMR